MIFDMFKGYKSEWKEVSKRFFTSDEASAVVDGVGEVVASKFGQSLCFVMVSTGEKKYLPLEPSSATEVGKKVNLTNVEMVQLHYEGTGKVDKDTILRARLHAGESDVNDFNNPFGL